VVSIVFRRDRRPRYQQIADDLRAQITNGRYAPGDQLPSIVELCHTYRVSKVTASSALAVLDQDGIIAVRHGRRSIVLTPQKSLSASDVVQVRQQVGAITHRQEQISHHVASLEQALRRIRQRMHHTRRQVRQLRRQGSAPQRPSESQPD
jgi:DNA-binding GntR family transcriptional regulator